MDIIAKDIISESELLDMANGNNDHIETLKLFIASINKGVQQYNDEYKIINENIN